MISHDDILAKRDEILNIAERYGAGNLRLFGSVARGETRAESDVDLLVHMEKSRSLLDRIALIQELEDLLHCAVDVVNEDALNPLIRNRVLAEAEAL